jgi:nitroreductase
MDTFETIETRRSVKHYDPEHRMTSAEVDRLLSAAVLSPTSFNMQNWRIVNVVDSARREEMCAAAWGQSQIKDASLLLVLCGDLRCWAKAPERYWRDAPPEVADQMVPMIRKFYESNEQLQRDEAMRSCGILAQTIMLAARAMGYDSCPMIGFDPARTAKIIRLPEDHVISMVLVVGKAAKPARPRSGQLPLDDVVFEDTF